MAEDAATGNSGEEEEYEVEEIIEAKLVGDQKLYRVRWLGYSSDQDTWEPRENLDCCPLIFERFRENEKAKKEKRKAKLLKDSAERRQKISRERISIATLSTSSEDEGNNAVTAAKALKGETKSSSTALTKKKSSGDSSLLQGHSKTTERHSLVEKQPISTSNVKALANVHGAAKRPASSTEPVPKKHKDVAGHDKKRSSSSSDGHTAAKRHLASSTASIPEKFKGHPVDRPAATQVPATKKLPTGQDRAAVAATTNIKKRLVDVPLFKEKDFLPPIKRRQTPLPSQPREKVISKTGSLTGAISNIEASKGVATPKSDLHLPNSSIKEDHAKLRLTMSATTCNPRTSHNPSALGSQDRPSPMVYAPQSTDLPKLSQSIVVGQKEVVNKVSQYSRQSPPVPYVPDEAEVSLSPFNSTSASTNSHTSCGVPPESIDSTAEAAVRSSPVESKNYLVEQEGIVESTTNISTDELPKGDSHDRCQSSTPYLPPSPLRPFQPDYEDTTTCFVSDLVLQDPRKSHRQPDEKEIDSASSVSKLSTHRRGSNDLPLPSWPASLASVEIPKVRGPLISRQVSQSTTPTDDKLSFSGKFSLEANHSKDSKPTLSTSSAVGANVHPRLINSKERHQAPKRPSSRDHKLLPQLGVKREHEIQRRNKELYNAVQTGNLAGAVHALGTSTESSATLDLEQPNERNSTLLMRAAINLKGAKLVRLLVERGANINFRHSNGNTPLCMAAQHGFVENVETFLEFGAHMDVMGQNMRPALNLAGRNVQIVKKLLDKGASFSQKCGNNLTVLDRAKQEGFKEVENCVAEHISKVTDEFYGQACEIFRGVAKMLYELFPIHCLPLNEDRTTFEVNFDYKEKDDGPRTGALLFVGHALFSSARIQVRFRGTCAITKVVLNSDELKSVIKAGKFVFLLHPLKEGPNELVIHTTTMIAGEVKLLVCAYKTKL